MVNPIFRVKHLRGLILQIIPGKSFDAAREQLQILGEIFTPVITIEKFPYFNTTPALYFPGYCKLRFQKRFRTFFQIVKPFDIYGQILGTWTSMWAIAAANSAIFLCRLGNLRAKKDRLLAIW